MGLRYRRSYKIAPGVKLNVGLKSFGISAGVRGARISTNTRTGSRVTVGLPGTGLSYSEKIGGKKRRSPGQGGAGQGGVARPAPHPWQFTQPNMAVDRFPPFGQVVHVAGSTLRWPWLCACCTQPLPHPPQGAVPVSGNTFYEVAVLAESFAPPSCGNCVQHQTLTAQAYRMADANEENGANYLQTALALSPVVWLVTALLAGLLTGSAAFGIILGALLAAGCGIAGYCLEQSRNEATQNADDTHHQQIEQLMQQAGQLTTSHCPGCAGGVTAIERRATGYDCWFANDNMAAWVTSLNGGNRIR